MIATQQKEIDKIPAYGGTILIHAALLFLLWLSSWSAPNPPLGEGGPGLAMSLGFEEAGGPSPDPVTDPSAAQPVPQEEQQQEQEIATQEEEEAPAVTTPPKDTRKPDVKPQQKPAPKPVTKPAEQPRRPDEKSLFQRRASTNEPGGSGTGTAPGNQGRPDGDPNGRPDGDGGNGNAPGSGGPGNGGNGPGGPGGSGIGGYVLEGRSITKPPRIEDNSRETGKVVLDIVVDRTGKVTKAIQARGTTTLNATLIAKAKQAALETRFSPKPDAPEEQFGKMTIVFQFKP